MEYIIEKKNNEDELIHYGVLGMKWGVHKGRVTASTENAIGDKYTNRQKNRMTKQATKLLSKKRKTYEVLSKQSENRSIKAKNDIAAKQYYNQSKINKEIAEMYKTRINDIETGKIKAGKDFVVNSIYSSNILLDAAGLLNVKTERRIDYNN